MPTLVLMRHAQAGHAPRDFDRPLSAAGRLQAAWMSPYLVQDVGAIDLALVSAARRTQQTVEALKSGGLTISQSWIEDFLYDATWEGVMGALREIPEDVQSVVVVGHEPSMSATAEMLSDGTFTLPAYFVPGAAAVGTVAKWSCIGSHSLSITALYSPPASLHE